MGLILTSLRARGSQPSRCPPVDTATASKEAERKEIKKVVLRGDDDSLAVAAIKKAGRAHTPMLLNGETRKDHGIRLSEQQRTQED